MTRIGLIGAGRWGRNAARAVSKALRTVVSDEGGRMTRTESIAELAWVCDADHDAAATLGREFGAVYYSGPPNFDDCDAVWCCTPIETHELLVHAALSAGKHVLCEKPLTRTRAQAVDLAADAERRGLTLMADHTWLGHLGALGVARDGIRKYRATRHALDTRGFDAIEDLLPHDVALSTHAMGPVRRVCVDGISISLDHGGGMHSSLSYRYDAETKVRRIDSFGPGVAYQSNEGELPPDAPEPLAVILDEFIAAIREQRQPRIGGAEEFVHVAAVIEAAKRSRADGGRWVDVV